MSLSDSQDWTSVDRALFDEISAKALAQPPAERVAFIRAACGDNERVADELVALFDRMQSVERREFLATPPELPTVAAADRGASNTSDANDLIGTVIDRYRLVEQIGEGGFGAVFRAEQIEPIQRDVAFKIIKLGMDTAHVIARFEVERQALAMMDHPNIAKVLDAGATDRGRPYFVMEFVAGQPITAYCDERKLSLTARLELFVAVCHAVQHAHQKGIIHRDIKPGNVLVAQVDGRPTPKVIDFGIAKAIEQRLTEQSMFTELGQFIGTPAYMSPEQAGAVGDDIDTRSDIYSLGVLLYELLTGATPFDLQTLRGAAFEEIKRVIREVEPPRPSTRLSTLGESLPVVAQQRSIEPHKLGPVLRGELDWVIMKALEKDRGRRYATAVDFAADVERFLKNEPVAACPPSRMYRLRKFVAKHRFAVGAIAAVALTLVAGLIATSVQYVRAESLAAEEASARQLAESRYDEIVRLADLKRLADARAAADELWPAYPDTVPKIEVWFAADVALLQENAEKHRATLEKLRAAAQPYDEAQEQENRTTHPAFAEYQSLQKNLAGARAELVELNTADLTQEINQRRVGKTTKAIADMETRLEELTAAVNQRRLWRFSNTADQWQHDTLALLVDDLAKFFDEDPSIGTVANVRERLAFAQSVEEKTVTSDAAKRAWAAAIADIRQLPAYNGLALTPQLGLLPLRRDPQSGFWEFLHVQTGAAPEPNPDPDSLNPWVLSGESGIVFVLLPGGTFQMGAQKDDPNLPNFDSFTEIMEQPVHDVTLAPFFISRYEMTQSQWLRFTHENPSSHRLDWIWLGTPAQSEPVHANTPWSPVENMTWYEANETLQQLGLMLPTEAQWEYAARGGTQTRWWTGDEEASIGKLKAGNFSDPLSRKKGAPPTWNLVAWEDDWVVHAPVGSFAPNAFGLHDVLGNLTEWCRDHYGLYRHAVDPGDGFRPLAEGEGIVIRGGAFDTMALRARSAYREHRLATYRSGRLGVRPVRAID